jgi:hypothetical protein
MSQTIGVSEYLEQSEAHARWAREELARIEQRRAELPATLAETETARQAAIDELARLWLPALDAAGLAHAARRTGIKQTDPLRRREKDREALERTLARLDAEPDFAARARLLDPVVGELTLAAQELREARAPLDETWARLQHPRLEHLVEVEYGTPRYAVPWWRASYYSDWAAGDEILERFPEKHTGDTHAFGALREIYLQLRESIREFDVRQQALEARVAQIHGLEAEHAAAAEGLRTIDQRHLDLTRRELAERCALLAPEQLARRNADDAELDALVKRQAGLAAKAGYLEEMRRELDRLSNELTGQVTKARAERTKYSRPKKAGTRFPRDKVAHRFRDRSASSQRYWERYDRGYARMRDFDDYGRVSLASDLLWWDVMTDGCHAPHLHSVTTFHAHHPDYRWHGRDDADAAAAIASAPDRHDLGRDAS